jgi:hypothetical protein
MHLLLSFSTDFLCDASNITHFKFFKRFNKLRVLCNIPVREPSRKHRSKFSFEIFGNDLKVLDNFGDLGTERTYCFKIVVELEFIHFGNCNRFVTSSHLMLCGTFFFYPWTSAFLIS